MRQPSFSILRRDLRRLRERAYRAQRKDQSEVCGVLVERPGRILDLIFLPNASPRPCSFELDVAVVSEQRRAARLRGSRVVGMFHSHPISEPVPSRRDLAEAPGNSLMLIYDVCGASAKLWRVKLRNGKKSANEQSLVPSA
jgi:desampylase